jgi:hypothetical protein
MPKINMFLQSFLHLIWEEEFLTSHNPIVEGYLPSLQNQVSNSASPRVLKTLAKGCLDLIGVPKNLWLAGFATKLFSPSTLGLSSPSQAFL